MDRIFPIAEITNTTNTSDLRRFGDVGETLAARFLRKNGFRLIVANFKVPVGRNRTGAQVTGEIDLIALDADVLCFIEVKTRRSEAFVAATANVDLRKQRQITRTARVYRRIFGVFDMEHRFDVVTVVIPPGERPVIELFKDFWTEARFRKRSWNDVDFSEPLAGRKRTTLSIDT
jgi:putative endonuclease